MITSNKNNHSLDHLLKNIEDKVLIEQAENNKKEIEKKLYRFDESDFFVLPRYGFSAKSDLYSLEFPFFSLTKKKDTNDFNFEYTNCNGEYIFIQIKANSNGRATIWDKEILIYIIGKLLSVTETEKNKVSRTVRVDVKEMLTSLSRSIGGDSYPRLIDTLDRLKGTTIKTNLRSNMLLGYESIGSFSFISEYSVFKKDYRSHKGKKIERAKVIDITLSHWVMLIVDECEVLTLNSDYFKLLGGIERRIYEIGRKHLGKQRKSFSIKYENLYLKLGSTNAIKPLFRELNKLSKKMSLPDLYFVCDEKREVVTFDHKVYEYICG